jgi:hypothetical protein
MHLLCSGSQRTRLRDRDERTDIVEIEVIHRQSLSQYCAGAILYCRTRCVETVLLDLDLP